MHASAKRHEIRAIADARRVSGIVLSIDYSTIPTASTTTTTTMMPTIPNYSGETLALICCP